MTSIEMKSVFYRYNGKSENAIEHINLEIKQGEFILLAGVSGCGKSTLLKTFNGIIPQESLGHMCGEVLVNNISTRGLKVSEIGKKIGVVFQNPDDQIFATTVFDEVAFALENRNEEAHRIEAAVEEILTQVGLDGFAERKVATLSGGQKQRLTLAAVMVAKPDLLILDEPISQIDPQGAKELLSILRKINKTNKTTIIIVEHRIHEVIKSCDRLIVMDKGRIVWDGNQDDVVKDYVHLQKMGLRWPQSMELLHCLKLENGLLVTEEIIKRIRRKCQINKFLGEYSFVKPVTQDLICKIENLSFSYNKNGEKTLKKINLDISKGEFIALMGKNGSGKTTLLKLLANLLLPKDGRIEFFGVKRIGLVLQNPDLMLFNFTVREEVRCESLHKKINIEEKNYQKILEKLTLSAFENEFPLTLSRGQRFRVAIAATLLAKPDMLILDEPTTGQDIRNINSVVDLLREYLANGGTVLCCTHDMEIAVQNASRIIILADGRIYAEGTVNDVFNNQEVESVAGIELPEIAHISEGLYGKRDFCIGDVLKHVQ